MISGGKTAEALGSHAVTREALGGGSSGMLIYLNKFGFLISISITEACCLRFETMAGLGNELKSDLLMGAAPAEA